MQILALVILALVILGIATVLCLGWFVHLTLDRICLMHARAFCRRNGCDIRRLRWQPAFEGSGVKTGSTLVQVDCIAPGQQRRLLLLLVWPFGFRKVLSDELYPEAYDDQWPQDCTVVYHAGHHARSSQ